MLPVMLSWSTVGQDLHTQLQIYALVHMIPKIWQPKLLFPGVPVHRYEITIN